MHAALPCNNRVKDLRFAPAVCLFRAIRDDLANRSPRSARPNKSRRDKTLFTGIPIRAVRNEASQPVNPVAATRFTRFSFSSLSPPPSFSLLWRISVQLARHALIGPTVKVMNADDFEVRTAAEKKRVRVACTASVCYLRHSIPFPAEYLHHPHPPISPLSAFIRRCFTHPPACAQ